jgi:uracil-DNA glycosylase
MDLNIITNWEKVLKIYIVKYDIENKYQRKRNNALAIYPKDNDIFKCFKCFNYFDVKMTKVVILGQDPYHGPDQATGLCFGVENDKIQPSLRNIRNF